MLEEGEALTTFRLLAEPGLGVVTDAEALPPHRMAYLDYEGPVSGGRGTVQRWDHGTYRLLSSSPAEKVVQLTGARLQATLALSDKSGKWFCDVKSP